jgi:hypothetical protein
VPEAVAAGRWLATPKDAGTPPLSPMVADLLYNECMTGVKCCHKHTLPPTGQVHVV